MKRKNNKEKQEIVKSKLEEIKRYEAGVNYYNEQYQAALKRLNGFEAELALYEEGSEAWADTLKKIENAKYILNSYQKLMNDQHLMAERLKSEIASM